MFALLCTDVTNPRSFVQTTLNTDTQSTSSGDRLTSKVGTPPIRVLRQPMTVPVRGWRSPCGNDHRQPTRSWCSLMVNRAESDDQPTIACCEGCGDRCFFVTRSWNAGREWCSVVADSAGALGEDLFSQDVGMSGVLSEFSQHWEVERPTPCVRLYRRRSRPASVSPWRIGARRNGVGVPRALTQFSGVGPGDDYWGCETRTLGM